MKVRFDAVAMFATVRELSRRLEGGRIRRIQQLGPDLYVFTIFRPRTENDVDFEGPEVRFIVGLAAASARIHLAERAYGTAETPTSFCMLLRKHLEGARIASLRTLGLERAAVLELVHYDDMEAGSLLIQLMPTARTLVLVDTAGRVLGEMRHRMRKGTAVPLLEGERPRHAMELSGDEIEAAVRALDPPLPLEKALTRVSFGIGTVHGREIATRAGLDPRRPYDGGGLARAWDEFWARVREGTLEPTSVEVSEEERLLLPFPFVSQAGRESTSFATMSRLVEDAFAHSLGQAGLDELRAHLLDAAHRQRDRVLRRIAAQEEDLRETARADTWKHYGDLLTTNIYRIPARSKKIQLEDYTRDNAPVEIALDPDLSPQENARAYYDRYKKAKRGVEAIAEAIAGSRQHLDYAESLAAAVQTARERDDLRELEAQMQAEKLLPGGVPKKRPKGPAARPRRVQIDGWDVLVGRNPRQNEQLTMRQARAEDWWLHARQIPGAHVIVRGPSPEMPEHVLLAAARLAAGYSRAAGDSRVPVDYTRVRYVKKPPGTPAGYVTYSREQTVMVEPGYEDLFT